MMTSVSSERSRGAREKTQVSAIQAAQLQKQVVQVSVCGPRLPCLELQKVREHVRFKVLLCRKHQDFEPCF